MSKPFGFDKSRHLCLERDIDPIFAEGRKLNCFPFRMLYRVRREETGVRLLIIARKKNFRHAVDRNRWRRMIREAYRVRQSMLEGLNLDICIIVVDTKMEESSFVSERMQKMLTTLCSAVSS